MTFPTKYVWQNVGRSRIEKKKGNSHNQNGNYRSSDNKIGVTSTLHGFIKKKKILIDKVLIQFVRECGIELVLRLLYAVHKLKLDYFRIIL